MSGRFLGKRFSSFQIIIAGFLAVIMAGTLLLSLPVSAASGEWTSAADALFTAASAVCVTGLAVKDTATYWSFFGQMELHLSSEVMSDVIEEALRHADKRASEHTIEIRDSGEILLVDMDARLIMQVLINLINNAVKNTPPGSEILIESKREGTEAAVTVRDNGPGIPDDVKPHVFEMFYTGQGKVADGRRGMGLRLALCKSIVESHHGRITLTDNDPSGCRFTFFLPMKEVQVNE